MIIIKNSEELAKLVNEYKDLILPKDDVRIEFEPTKKEIRNVECRNLYLENEDGLFDFNGWEFNGLDFNGLDFNGWDFNGGDFNGGDFNGWDFKGGDFNGWDFNGVDFNGGDFNGRDFNGRDFKGGDFNGWDFNGGDFNGKNISYYAFFICYNSCTCTGYISRRENALPIQCLDGELTVIK